MAIIGVFIIAGLLVGAYFLGRSDGKWQRGQSKQERPESLRELRKILEERPTFEGRKP